MAAREVVGGILLAGDELLWVEELAIGSGAHFINDGRFLMWPLMEAFCVTLLHQSTSIYVIMNLTYVI